MSEVEGNPLAAAAQLTETIGKLRDTLVKLEAAQAMAMRAARNQKYTKVQIAEFCDLTKGEVTRILAASQVTKPDHS